MPSYTITGVLESVRSHCPKPVLTEASAGGRDCADSRQSRRILSNLIERAAKLNCHAGEIAFPGGKHNG